MYDRLRSRAWWRRPAGDATDGRGSVNLSENVAPRRDLGREGVNLGPLTEVTLCRASSSFVHRTL